MSDLREREELCMKHRERKQTLDKWMRIVSGLLIAAPAAAFILITLDSLPPEISKLLNTRGRAGGHITSPIAMLIAVIFSVGNVFGGSASVKRFAPFLYFGELILAVIFLIQGSYFEAVLFLIVFVLSFILSLAYKKLYFEEQKMHGLEGYPAFNPFFLSREFYERKKYDDREV